MEKPLSRKKIPAGEAVPNRGGTEEEKVDMPEQAHLSPSADKKNRREDSAVPME